MNTFTVFLYCADFSCGFFDMLDIFMYNIKKNLSDIDTNIDIYISSYTIIDIDIYNCINISIDTTIILGIDIDIYNDIDNINTDASTVNSSNLFLFLPTC